MPAYWNENRGTFSGLVMSPPQFSHENHGEDYFHFSLAVARLSGVEDLLPVMVSRSLLDGRAVRAGERLGVTGEIRSFNNHTGVGSRLVLSVFARTLEDWPEEDQNAVRLCGTLCKAPVYRHTPLGREICDLTLAVNRRYGRADYLPCIAWGTVARTCAALGSGDALRLDGRFQSRIYSKTLDGQVLHRTAYEVSIMSMEQITQI